jgi:muramoyltetrapeptide carboxypeptidase
MDDMISREILPDIDVPVAFGFPAGHGKRNYPLLMGAEARLEVRDGNFTLSWI